MTISLIIAFLSLIFLLVLHEFSHFITAKKFGIRVDEFGIGYPPRIFGKKFRGTLYSINLLPFGAFIRVPSDQNSDNDPQNFQGKPFWQKAIVISAGVISFWMIAAILLSIEMGIGVPTAIGDEETENLINPKVQVALIMPDSPAQKAELNIGDSIVKLSFSSSQFNVITVKQVQDFINSHKGEEITLTVQRGKETIDISLVPRLSPPAEEGPLGIALVRTAIKKFPWYRSPIEGVKATALLTKDTVLGWGDVIKSLINRQPTGVQLVGPVGVLDLFAKASQLGVNYFLQFIAIISVYMAVFNILPIPVTDGGRLLFLVIGKIRGKPIRQKIEQGIDAVFFFLLIGLMVWVTIKDIIRLF